MCSSCCFGSTDTLSDVAWFAQFVLSTMEVHSNVRGLMMTDRFKQSLPYGLRLDES